MLSWACILYGAALPAVVAGAALAVLARPRQPAVILTGVLGTAAGPLAWNATLRVPHASQFFTDAPLRLLPASWQDAGSGLFALRHQEAGQGSNQPGLRRWRAAASTARRQPAAATTHGQGLGRGCSARPRSPAPAARRRAGRPARWG